MHVTYCREINFDSFVGNVLSCQVSDEESLGGFRGWQCTCIDSLAEYLEPLLASAVGASDISYEAIVEEVLGFELKVILAEWSWGISIPQVELMGDS